MMEVSSSPVSRSIYRTTSDTLLSLFSASHRSPASVSASGAVRATRRGSPSKEGRGLPSRS